MCNISRCIPGSVIYILKERLTGYIFGQICADVVILILFWNTRFFILVVNILSKFQPTFLEVQAFIYPGNSKGRVKEMYSVKANNGNVCSIYV